MYAPETYMPSPDADKGAWRVLGVEEGVRMVVKGE